MKLKIASAVLFTAVAASAFADELPALSTDSFASTKTRAEVQAELMGYKQAGVNPYATLYNQLVGFKSTRSRQEVVAEYMAARNEVAALNSEDSGSAYLTQVAQRARTSTGPILAGYPVNPQ